MDDDITLRLQCDVELNFPAPNVATVNKWAADILRRLADRIESDEFEDGHHPVTDSVGKPVGSIYVNYEGVLEL